VVPAATIVMARGDSIHPCGSRGDQDSIGGFAVGINAGQVRAGEHNRLLMIEGEPGQTTSRLGNAAHKGWRHRQTDGCNMIIVEQIKFLFVGTHCSVR